MTSSIRSPFRPWPEPTVFAGVPVLPVVPLPLHEEDIASWLRSIAETYGLNLTAYLTYLGTPRVQVGTCVAAELILNPSEKLLARIQQDTGLHRDRLAAMTFIGLDPDLASAALNHDTPCPTCTATAVAQAGRPVSLLGARAAWRVVCPLHPPFPRPEEISAGVDLAPVYVRVREILSILDRAAFDPKVLKAHMPAIHPAVTAGRAVHFAYLLNSFVQVRLEAYDTLRDLAVFQVVRAYEPVQRGRPTPLPVDARNDRALSMLLAWQLLSLPTWALLVGLRLQAADGPEVDGDTTARAVFDLLLDVWPGELLSKFIVGNESDNPDRNLSPDRLTTFSVRLTAPFGNHPDFEAIRRVASEQHSAFVRHLFSREVRRRPVATYSVFRGEGPFRYRVPPAGGRAAASIALLSRNAWKRRVWKKHLQKLRPKPPARATPKTFESPIELMSAETISPVVERAVLEVGPPPVRMKAEDRRRYWKKLVRAGNIELAQVQRGEHL